MATADAFRPKLHPLTARIENAGQPPTGDRGDMRSAGNEIAGLGEREQFSFQPDTAWELVGLLVLIGPVTPSRLSRSKNCRLNHVKNPVSTRHSLSFAADDGSIFEALMIVCNGT